MPIPVPAPPVAAPASAPTLLGEASWAALPGYMRRGDDGTVRALLNSVGAPVDAQAGLLTDPARLTDPDRCPRELLPLLAAAAGVGLTGIPDDRQRAVIADPQWRYRGSETTILARVAETLTGARQVQIEHPYLADDDKILVRTFTDETPDPATTAAAIRAEVPAWLELTVDVADGMDYDALAAAYPTYDDMTSTGKTYQTLSQET